MTIEVQIIDWIPSDKITEEEYTYKDETKIKLNRAFMIRAFGRTLDGQSVTVNIDNYPPHYYIQVPNTFSKHQIKRLMDNIKSKLEYSAKDIITYNVLDRKKFWGFTPPKESWLKFIQIQFKNTFVLKKALSILKEPIRLGTGKATVYEVLESNIPPLLRFIHTNDIKPAGWIKMDKYTEPEKKCATTDIEVDIDWKHVIPIEKAEMAPFIIASYDIEADSSHGDFPLAKKEYNKLATEIVTHYLTKKLDKLSYQDLVYILNYYLNEAFSSNTKDNGISKVYTKREFKNKDSIQIVAEKLAYSLKRKETYRILIVDIISQLDIKLKSTKNVDNVYYSLEAAYNEISKEELNEKSATGRIKSNKQPIKQIIDRESIHKIHTYQNIKPSKSTLNALKSSFMTLYTKFQKQFEDYDLDDVNDVLHRLPELYFKESIDEEIEPIIGILNTFITQFYALFKDKLPSIDTSKETIIKRCNEVLKKSLPELQGDRVIQIGTTLQRYGEKVCYKKHITTLDTCSPIKDTIVEACETEEDVLLKWTQFIQNENPDIITGYNIFGFDYKFMYERAEELYIRDDFCKLSRIQDKVCELETKKLASSALGDNTLQYIDMEGRVQLDLYKVIQRDHNLVSYKLDYVAETFINDNVTSISDKTLVIKNSINLNPGNFITLKVDNEPYKKGKKFKINSIDYSSDTITLYESLDIELSNSKCIYQLAKDDVSPNDIFRYQKGTADERRIVATYCIQDCALCLHIINKLQIITNNIAMANVCFVPLSFIFLRGQGIKILSLVSKQCKKENFLIPVIKPKKQVKGEDNPFYDYGDEGIEEELNDDDGYEGAIVLKPHPDIYLNKYVVVLDYASLYPSSMISHNLSHDSIVLDDRYLGDEGAKRLKELGYGYEDVQYDTYAWIDKKIKSKGKRKTGVKVCRYVQPPTGEKSVIPRILQALLSARKATKKRMKDETDAFQKSVLDGLQLAFKVTANSLYGQVGASTSAVHLKDIAASTTAIGRSLLYLAKDKTEEHFKGAKAIYGDTDSVFIDFSPRDADGNLLTGKEGLKRAIELGVQAEEHIQNFLKPPHKLEYEKTFWPFILFSKKRYIGYKYEFDIESYKETSMGIVLKRRDNAEIVKHVYASVINSLLKERDLKKSIKILQKQLMDLLDGKYPLDMLIISKSLRGYYKNPDQIAHKVLADRIGKREPGNKPMVNDRVPYVYIETKSTRGQTVLQGDKIESPDYIIRNKLRPDYTFYITNQIMKPVGQIYALIVEKLEGFKHSETYYSEQMEYYVKKLGYKKAKDKITDLRMTDANTIIFGEILRVAKNRKNKTREITDFFKRN